MGELSKLGDGAGLACCPTATAKRNTRQVTPLNRLWPKLATFGTGLLIKKALDYPFDYFLYPIPLISLGYLRKGSGKYDGLSRRSWAIFWASTLVSNLMWAGSLVSLIEVFRYLR